MRTLITAFTFTVLAASSAAAQDRDGYRGRGQGVPPGHLPPPGECRVWYGNRPAGQQPPPTSCREAERVASRDRYARVIYGEYGGRGYGERGDYGPWGPAGRGERDRAIPRRDERDGYPYPDRYPTRDRYPVPERYPYPDGGSSYPGSYPGDRGRYGNEPFDNGYKDGYAKGREDAGDRDAYDPRRHRQYRSADRGYDRRYGSKAAYGNVYRDGFRAGYDAGYRERNTYGTQRQSNRRLPWPF